MMKITIILFYRFVGYFMYIETSSPRKSGEVAVLQSKLYPASTSGRCLQFYYNMYGEDMGSLTVKISYSSDAVEDAQLWKKEKDQGTQWVLARVQIPPGTSLYRVTKENNCGEGGGGDSVTEV